MWKARLERKIKKKKKDADLTPHEHERALKGAYKSFVMPLYT